MKATSAKETVIKSLISKGFNFDKDVFTLSCEEKEVFKNLAKEFKYKGSKTSYFASSKGSQFYLHLQKIYNKMK